MIRVENGGQDVVVDEERMEGAPGVEEGEGDEPPTAAAPTVDPPSTTSDNSLHSPWEIFRWESVKDTPLPPNTPQVDESLGNVVSAAIAIAADQAPWLIFQAAPEWNENYRSIRGRSEYYNRRVPLPLGLFDIISRIGTQYYRQKEALQHDIRTISDNARLFHGGRSGVASAAGALARYLLAVMVKSELEGGGGEGGDVDVSVYVKEAENGWKVDGYEDEGRRKKKKRQNDAEKDEKEGEEEPAPDNNNNNTVISLRGTAVTTMTTRRGTDGDGGRYSLRRGGSSHQRMNYRDLVDDEVGEPGEEGDEEEGEDEDGRYQGQSRSSRKRRSRRAPEVPLHHYSTRRAQAADIAAAVAASEQQEQVQVQEQRPSLTIRLRRPPGS